MSVQPITIDRRSDLTPMEFRKEYAEKRRPVVLTHATRAWEATRTMTPEWLAKKFGAKPIAFGGDDIPLRELLDILAHAEPGQPIPYPFTVQIEEHWPELLQYLDPLPHPHGLPNRAQSSLFRAQEFGSKTEVFFGGKGGDFPYAHVDYYHLHAWINMIFGVKEFWVFATDDDRNMYPEPPDNWRSSVPNVFQPDFEKYPLMRNVIPSKIEVGPGESLYIPAGTWHTARSLSLTMSVAFDQLDSMNMMRFTRDVMTYKERPLADRLRYAAYFAVIGQAAGAIEKVQALAKSTRALRGLV